MKTSQYHQESTDRKPGHLWPLAVLLHHASHLHWDKVQVRYSVQSYSYDKELRQILTFITSSHFAIKYLSSQPCISLLSVSGRGDTSHCSARSSPWWPRSRCSSPPSASQPSPWTGVPWLISLSCQYKLNPTRKTKQKFKFQKLFGSLENMQNTWVTCSE